MSEFVINDPKSSAQFQDRAGTIFACRCMNLPGCARLGRCRVANPPQPGYSSENKT